MEEKIDMPFPCPECEGEMHRVYTNEQVKEIVAKSKMQNALLRMKYTVQLRNQWVCKECKHYKELSRVELMKNYMDNTQTTPIDLAKDAVKVREEALEKFKEFDKDRVKVNKKDS